MARTKKTLMERSRAAKSYLASIHDPARQAEVELHAFMALFHPEVPQEKVREMGRDVKAKAKAERY